MSDWSWREKEIKYAGRKNKIFLIKFPNSHNAVEKRIDKDAEVM